MGCDQPVDLGEIPGPDGIEDLLVLAHDLLAPGIERLESRDAELGLGDQGAEHPVESGTRGRRNQGEVELQIQLGQLHPVGVDGLGELVDHRLQGGRSRRRYRRPSTTAAAVRSTADRAR